MLAVLWSAILFLLIWFSYFVWTYEEPTQKVQATSSNMTTGKEHKENNYTANATNGDAIAAKNVHIDNSVNNYGITPEEFSNTLQKTIEKKTKK